VVLYRQGHLRPDAVLRRRVGRMVLSSLAMAGTLYLVQPWLFASAHGDTTRLLALAALVGIGLAAYVAATQVTGAYDLREIPRRLRRRR